MARRDFLNGSDERDASRSPDGAYRSSSLRASPLWPSPGSASSTSPSRGADLAGSGMDARCYWVPDLADPYLHSNWTDQIAYPYSPAFLQLLQPIRLLPWQVFMAIWAAILMAAMVYLTGPRLILLGLAFFGLMEIWGGNIELLVALAIVAGLPLAGGLVVRAADQDHARRRAAVVRGPARVALPGDRPRRDRRGRGASRRARARRLGPLDRGSCRRTPARTGHGPRFRSRSSSASRSRSSWSSGAPEPTVAGPCPSRRCWRCPHSGTAA